MNQKTQMTLIIIIYIYCFFSPGPYYLKKKCCFCFFSVFILPACFSIACLLFFSLLAFLYLPSLNIEDSYGEIQIIKNEEEIKKRKKEGRKKKEDMMRRGF